MHEKKEKNPLIKNALNIKEKSSRSFYNWLNDYHKEKKSNAKNKP